MDTSTLNDMIEVLDDGRKFYEEAAAEVDRADLKALFTRMARAKEAIGNDLRSVVAARGEKPPEGGSWAGSVRQAYADLRVMLSKDKTYAYIAELEGFEDRIMQAFRDAAAKSSDATVNSLAERYMSEVSRDHAQMSTLKHLHAA